MKKRFLLLLPVLVLLLAVFVVPHQAQDAQPKRPLIAWEYKTLTRAEVEALAPKGAANNLTGGLNAVGSDSWELAAIDPAVNVHPGPGRDSTSAVYYFKRQK
jgi:hypothetical protein